MADSLPALTAALADRYHLERELGQGGMATVYLAHDIKHDRKVAIKVLRPELAAVIGAERFLSEIKTTANLQHPHILPLFDSGIASAAAESPNRPIAESSNRPIAEFLFYVMPYIEGESLRDRLNREQQLPIPDAVRIASEIAGALDYAHRHNVIHRDIKPENILLHDGRALVADFGIALAASKAGGSRMTETGMSLGTPTYMSPEQAMGEREITARSDVYALGCVLYEMLAGEPPFMGPTAQAIVARVMTEQPRSLTLQRHTIPAHVEAAVERALEKLPADRFQSAAEFAAALAGDGTAPGRAGRGRIYAAPTAGPGAIGMLLGHRGLPWALAGALLVAIAVLARRGGTADGSPLPTRFAAELDQVQSFPNTAPVLVTPDGQTVIVTAIVGRRPVLVARRLDRFETTIIPGSEGATRPFLSDDGRWIGFAASGKLMKLPLEGGTPVALADSRWGGGTWDARGTIVYPQSYQSGLWTVNASGGEARELTRPDSASGELAHWWPQLLPDGRHLIFTAYRTPYTRATIELLDLRSGKRRVLIEGGLMGRYVPSGHLLFARDESVLAVPFNLGKLSVGGAPVVVLDSVAMNYSDGFAAYDVSPTGTVAYLPASVARSSFLLVESDRRGSDRPLLAAPERFNNPRWAPDQRRIAVDIAAPRTAQDVWVLDPARGSRQRVTAESSADFGAAWTPDGRSLIYMSERPLFELYRRAADGSRAAEPLLTGSHDRIIGSISADAKLLAFVLSVPGSAELWTVPLQGAPEARKYLSNGSQLGHPAISPDGRWMAYDSDESGRVEVYLQSFPDPTGALHQVSSGGGSEPVWARGGRELVFRRGDSVMVAPVEPKGGEVGVPTTLFSGPYSDAPEWSTPRSYDVSPDGQRFLLLKRPATDLRRQVVIVTGWWAELRARVAGAQQ